MGLKFYCGGEFPDNEYDQFEKLKNILTKKYQNSNKEVIVIYNFYIEDHQIDVVIIKDDGILIIEMKNYEGDIFGTKEGDWYIKRPENEKIIIKAGNLQNPYIQCKAQRSKFTNKLMDLINLKKLKQFPQEKQTISRSIKAWVLFNGSSPYKGAENSSVNDLLETSPWFNIVNDENLFDQLNKIQSPLAIVSEDKSVILEALKVNPCRAEDLSDKRPQVPAITRKNLTIIQEKTIPLNKIEISTSSIELMKSKYGARISLQLEANVMDEKVGPSRIEDSLAIMKFVFNRIFSLINAKAAKANSLGILNGLNQIHEAFVKPYHLINELTLPKQIAYGSYLYNFEIGPILESEDRKSIILFDSINEIIIFGGSFYPMARISMSYFKGQSSAEDYNCNFINENLVPRLRKFTLDNSVEDLNITFFAKDSDYKKYKEGIFEFSIREFDAFVDDMRFDLTFRWTRDLLEEIVYLIIDKFVAGLEKILVDLYDDKRFHTCFRPEESRIDLEYAPLSAERLILDLIYNEVIPLANLK